MATPGAAWADGVWADGVWADGVWAADVAVGDAQTGDAQAWAILDLPAFFGDTAEAFAELTTDLDTWMDLDMGFAESVFIGVTELAGIFDDDSIGGSERLGPLVMMKTSDIVDNSIDQGSALTIRTRTFYVRGVQRNGTGISTVVLEE